jgi:GMP synthase (glutamine-hydrolysing)
MARDSIVILDFGSQYTQLIARRLRELQVYSEILPPRVKPEELLRRGAKGIVLSGGPTASSTRARRAATSRPSPSACPCSASATACS